MDCLYLSEVESWPKVYRTGSGAPSTSRLGSASGGVAATTCHLCMAFLFLTDWLCLITTVLGAIASSERAGQISGTVFKFLFRNTIASTVRESSDARCLVRVSPHVENALSELTLVPGIARYSRARVESRGNLFSFMQYTSVSPYQCRTGRSYVSNKSIPGTRVLEMDPSTRQNGPENEYPWYS